MIKVQNLQKSFDDLQVLKGIDLEVEKGETIAIIGPSGSGKSTFLRCLNLLETPDAGQVQIGEHAYDAKHLTKKKTLEIQRSTAMVFQNYSLFANKNVLENITLPLIKVKKVPAEQAHKTAIELLEKVGLSDKADAMPIQLSGGQQQRVGIARALALNPDVILYDEPTSALDPELVQGVLDVIKQVAQEKMTSIIVTHEMSFARDVADRVIFMDQGYVVEQGPAYEVITNPQQERTRQFLQGFLKG
jgi:ABC-type polar amino acid transport system ATPase subunit